MRGTLERTRIESLSLETCDTPFSLKKLYRLIAKRQIRRGPYLDTQGDEGYVYAETEEFEIDRRRPAKPTRRRVWCRTKDDGRDRHWWIVADRKCESCGRAVIVEVLDWDTRIFNAINEARESVLCLECVYQALVRMAVIRHGDLSRSALSYMGKKKQITYWSKTLRWERKSEPAWMKGQSHGYKSRIA